MNKKIAFFTPYYKSNRGNSITTRRIVHGLKEAGIDTHVFPYLEERWSDEKDEVLKECDLYHILHIYRFAKWNMCRELPLDKPYILTSGGTDINHDLANPAQLKEMDKMIKQSSAITVFTEDGRNKVHTAYPEKTVYIIPQSVWFEEGNNESIQLPDKHPIILLPAGLRAVKDPLYVWNELKQLKLWYPGLQFIIAGVVIEEDVYQQVLALTKKYDWVHFYENVPFHQMKSLYQQVDLTINTSISEGQPSSIIEAMFNDCPVLVRDNEGNTSIVKDEVNGLVFKNKEEFALKASLLLKNDTSELTKRAKDYVLEHHSLEKEIQQYVRLYTQSV